MRAFSIEEQICRSEIVTASARRPVYGQFATDFEIIADLRKQSKLEAPRQNDDNNRDSC